MTIEVTAKKVDDAIKQGLVQLGAELDEVRVEVLESGGFLRKAKVRLTLERAEAQPTEKPKAAPVPARPDKPTPEKKDGERRTENRAQAKPDKPVDKKPAAKAPEKNSAEAARKMHEPKKPEQRERREPTEQDKQAAELAFGFVKEVVAKMGFDATAERSADGETINITAPDGDDSLIIGRHGETLAALSFLAETCARAEKCHLKVTVDCNGYRDRRAASLAAMARRRADECVKRHRKIKLEPMDRNDRRTVHSALTDDDRVTTASEGKEPHRCVVILPKRNDGQ